MVKPKCPKCDNTLFKSTAISSVNGNFKLLAVHCYEVWLHRGNERYRGRR
jgi:hypothetical protein